MKRTSAILKQQKEKRTNGSQPNKRLKLEGTVGRSRYRCSVVFTFFSFCPQNNTHTHHSLLSGDDVMNEEEEWRTRVVGDEYTFMLFFSSFFIIYSRPTVLYISVNEKNMASRKVRQEVNTMFFSNCVSIIQQDMVVPSVDFYFVFKMST